MASRGALERGYVRANLIRALAAGEKTQSQLAELYGVTQQSISEFAQRHKLTIEHTRANLDDEYAHLWIAQKGNRIAEYEKHVDTISQILDEGARSSVPTSEMLRTAQAALKAVAEELGQLPNRQQIQHSGSVSVNYVVDGLDPEVLR